MEIKHILEYDYNYAEYMVTDGKYDVICMCMSVPLENNTEPKTGMKVGKIYTFSINNPIVLKISDSNQCYIQKDPRDHFEYKLCGIVVDSIKAIIRVFDFVIDLINDYPNGFDAMIKNGDYIEFCVDRLDCEIESEI